MASSLTNLWEEISKLQELLQKKPEPGLFSTWNEAVRSVALKIRGINDELFNPPDLIRKKEKALMLALQYIAGGLNLGLSAEKEHNRTARIFEAAKIIHRASDQKELKRGLDDLDAA